MTPNDDYQLGLLVGEVREIAGITKDIRKNQVEIWKHVNEIKDNLNDVRVASAKYEQELSDLKRKVPSTDKFIKRMNRPWDQPTGELFYTILISAIKTVSIGVVIAIILYGVTNITLG